MLRTSIYYSKAALPAVLLPLVCAHRLDQYSQHQWHERTSPCRLGAGVRVPPPLARRYLPTWRAGCSAALGSDCALGRDAPGADALPSNLAFISGLLLQGALLQSSCAAPRKRASHSDCATVSARAWFTCRRAHCWRSCCCNGCCCCNVRRCCSSMRLRKVHASMRKPRRSACHQPVVAAGNVAAEGGGGAAVLRLQCVCVAKGKADVTPVCAAEQWLLPAGRCP